MRILYIVPYAPTRIRTRPYHLIRALAADGHAVSLATLWSTESENEAVQRLAQDLDLVISERIRHARSLWNCLQAVPTSRPLQAAYSWSPLLARKTSSMVENNPFDVIHIEHLRGVRYGLLVKSAMFHPDLPRPAIVWDSVDCISTLFRQAAQAASSVRSKCLMRFELPRTEAYEGWLASRFDRVLVASEQDRLDLLALSARLRCNSTDPRSVAGRVAAVPNGVDLEYFSPIPEPRDPRTLVITGKMSYHANVSAVLRFVEDVMPRIWAEIPDVRLWIVGQDPPPELRRLGADKSRILVTGAVDDIRPYLRRATVAVAPIRYGVGIQNKVLEALACGTPVVGTPQAVSGLSASWGETLMVAAEPQDFADAVILLLREPQLRAKFGQAGRLFVERQHDWRCVARDLAQIYRCAKDDHAGNHQ